MNVNLKGTSEPQKLQSAELRQPLLNELYAQSQAASYGFTVEQFAKVLAECTKPGTDLDSAESAIRALRVEELALARGCAAGNEHAWEVFLTRYREKLFEAAKYITKDEAAGRELADSIYAELYGTRVDEGGRVSKLESYAGRGSLEGWLRTVLAQEWVNRFRKRKREVSLEEQEEAGAQFVATVPESANEAAKPEVTRAVDASLAELSAEERYILASYYLDERTLAEIARSLKVHESTISRKVEKLAQKLRKGVMDALLRAGMSRRQAEEAMEVDVRDLAVDVRSGLTKQARGRIP